MVRIGKEKLMRPFAWDVAGTLIMGLYQSCNATLPLCASLVERRLDAAHHAKDRAANTNSAARSMVINLLSRFGLDWIGPMCRAFVTHFCSIFTAWHQILQRARST